MDFVSAAMEVCAVGGPALVALCVVSGSIFKITEREAAVLETNGRYARTVGPGWNFKLPILTRIKARVNLKTIQSDFEIKAVTKDPTFLDVPISLHHKIVDPARAIYELDEPEKQMESFITEVVLATTSKMGFNDFCAKLDEVNGTVKKGLNERVKGYGYEIVDLVLKQPKPSDEVRAASDRVISSKRALEAAQNEAEANRIKIEAAAQADGNSMRIYGKALGDQSIAYAEGLTAAAKTIHAAGIPIEHAMAFMVMTNGQEAAVKASGNQGTTILSTVSGGQILDDATGLVARLNALPKAKLSVPAAV